MPGVDLVVEGPTDEAVLGKVCQYAGLTPRRVFGKTGKQYVLDRLQNYNQAGKWYRWVALVDFNSEATCVGVFVTRHLPAASPCMRFRVAVRSIESWLLADREAIARYLSVPTSRVPLNPDSLPHPKQEMINLARRSRSSRIRRDMVPRQGSGATEGPAYASTLQQFVLSHSDPWHVNEALAASESLRRCVAALRTLTNCGPEV